MALGCFGLFIFCFRRLTQRRSRFLRRSRHEGQSRIRSSRSARDGDESVTELQCTSAAGSKISFDSDPPRLIIHSGRAGSALNFPGRANRQQRFSIVSFPGIYEKEWTTITESQRSVKRKLRLAVACVFFPDEGSSFYGEHDICCRCASLYQGSHPDFESWPDGKAPWGCLWFKKWEDNIQDVVCFKQVPVVVYKRGLVSNDADGLGFSQRGEVRRIRELGLNALAVDIDEIMELIPRMARDVRDYSSGYGIIEECADDEFERLRKQVDKYRES